MARDVLAAATDAHRDPATRISVEALTNHTARILRACGVSDADADAVAAVLVASDVRGISSHGVARLPYYVAMIEAGTIDPLASPRVVRDSASTAVLDACNGLGQPVGIRAMTLAIDKAAAHDVGIVTVRHSNHYGIAGYYAMMALERDMIGISLTNTHPAVAPTGGSRPTIGTNPIAIAVPTGESLPFVLDMASSAVPRGRLEVAARQGTTLPIGWALDALGAPTTSPEAGLAGALLPLGGPLLTSGYKGYGLAVAVEMLAAVLPGSLYGPLVAPMWDTRGPSDLGQFFMAINLAAFDDPAAFKARAADLLRRLKASPMAEGETEILVAGEKEERAGVEARRHGIALDATVADQLAELCARYDLPPLPV